MNFCLTFTKILNAFSLEILNRYKNTPKISAAKRPKNANLKPKIKKCQKDEKILKKQKTPIYDLNR